MGISRLPSCLLNQIHTLIHMYTFNQLLDLTASLAEPPRVELLYYIYFYPEISQKQLLSVTGWTQTKVNRHFRVMRQLKVIELSPGGVQNLMNAQVVKHYLPFFENFFSMLDIESRQVFDEKYKANKLFLIE